MMSTYVAAGANVILLVGILYPSIINLIKTRSSVPTLLVAFSSAFLVQNLAAVYFHMVVPYTLPVEVEFLVLTVLETVGFGALFWVTYK